MCEPLTMCASGCVPPPYDLTDPGESLSHPLGNSASPRPLLVGTPAMRMFCGAQSPSDLSYPGYSSSPPLDDSVSLSVPMHGPLAMRMFCGDQPPSDLPDPRNSSS